MTGTPEADGPSSRATVVFDDECGRCREAATWIRTHGSDSAFELLAAQSPEVPRRFPALSPEACEREMHIVLENGSVRRGADAVLAILERVPRWRGVARGLGWGPLRPVLRLLYRGIARTRHRNRTE